MSDRIYEILFIADPNLGEPEVDALAAQVQGFVEKDGGKLQKMEKWGKKRLAYDVRRHREGYYVLLVVEGTGAMVKEVERRLKVTDGIIRFLTVRVDEELRKAERRKAKRALGEEKRQGPRRAPQPARERGGAAVSSQGNGGGAAASAGRRRRPGGGAGGGAGAKGGGAGQGRRRQALLLPPAQGLQVLRGQDRLRRLQGRQAASRSSCPSGARSCPGACSAPAPSTSAS